MADVFPPVKQRPRLLELLEALAARTSSLRRDEYGDWAIFGKLGHIYAVPEGFQLMCMSREAHGARWWSGVKERLGSFCEFTLDCDGDGAFILSRLRLLPRGLLIIRKAVEIPRLVI